MKKATKLVLTALMVATMAFALCACGKNIDGTYVVSEYNGQSVDDAIAQMQEQGMEITADQLGTCTLSNGKDATLSMMGESKTGTYELSGENLTMTIDNETKTLTYKDDAITYSEGGISMTMKKK